jgi:S-DNA-T family DNA segregation ATPase FtsK/SpoIIIE
LVLLCLLSYNPHDSSFNVLASKIPDNKIGKIGAHAADLLFQVLGFSAFLLPLPLFILSWKFVFARQIHTPYLRTFGLFLLILGASSVLQLLPIKMRDASVKPGGLVGVLIIDDLLLPNLNKTGTIIVITGALVLGILASTTLSLGNFLTNLGPETGLPRPKLWERFRKWRMNRKPARTVVNIKSASPPPLDLTPRPAPVKTPFVPAEPRPTPPPVVRAPDPPPVRQSSSPAPAEGTKSRKFTLPPVELLSPGENPFPVNEADLMERARMLSDKCAEFDVNGSITQIHPGPVVTTFEFKPDAGVKYARIRACDDRLVTGIRPDRPTPVRGLKSRTSRELIMLRELIESTLASSRLTPALGNRLTQPSHGLVMPHLIAGATGSGKSVTLNA